MKKKTGFTLVELLAVIVILAILATAAFTLVLPQIEKSRKKSFVSEVASIIDSAELYFLEHPTELSVKIEDLKPYIKNYDYSKVGCVIAPTSAGDNFTVRFSNGDYKTDGTSFYEMGELKTSSGAATDNVVKIDSDHPNFTDSCTSNPDSSITINNLDDMKNAIKSAADNCIAKFDGKSYCKKIDGLFSHGWLDRSVYEYYLNSPIKCIIYNRPPVWLECSNK